MLYLICHVAREGLGGIGDQIIPNADYELYRFSHSSFNGCVTRAHVWLNWNLRNRFLTFTIDSQYQSTIMWQSNPLKALVLQENLLMERILFFISYFHIICVLLFALNTAIFNYRLIVQLVTLKK